MDPDITMEQAEVQARQAVQQGYRHFTVAWEQAGAVAGALTHRQQDLEVFRSVAAQATMVEPGAPASRVVVDQAGDIRRALGTHTQSVGEVGAHVRSGVEAFSTGAAALGVLADRALDPQLRQAAEHARSSVEFAREVGRAAQEGVQGLAQPLRASSQMLAGTAEATATTPGMPASALSAGRDAQEILGRARGRAHDLVETLDQLYQHGAPAVPAVGEEERAGQPIPAAHTRQAGLEKERRDPQHLRAAAPMAAGLRR